MGSGGMIVMDEASSMVDVARYFMEFCMDESCGKCIPCRAGTRPDARLAGQDRQGPGHGRRSGSARGAVRGGPGHQPVRAGTNGSQSGAEHAALLSTRIRRRAASARGSESTRQAVAAQGTRPLPARRRASMTPLPTTAGPVRVVTLQDQRPRRQCARRRVDLGSRAGERHPDPFALLHGRAQRLGRLPALHDRDPGRPPAARRLFDPGGRRHGGADRTRRGCRSIGG